MQTCRNLRSSCVFWRKLGKSNSDLFVIVGLGNPGKEYTASRHNAGYLAIDRLMDRYGIKLSSKKFDGLSGRGTIDGRKVMLVKPTTFMNNSGRCVKKIVDYYKLDPANDLVILYDDIDLEPGMLRVRTKGSAGSHNGMKSVIQHLKTQEFTRIRIGVGTPPPQMDLVDWVLGKIPKTDEGPLNMAYDHVCDVMPLILEGDMQEAMNRYNRRG